MSEASRFEPSRRVPLGTTDVRVFQLSVGTVPLAGLFAGVSEEHASAVVEAAWDSGVRFFDLAPLFGYGFAERVVGEFLRDKPRGEYALATKVGRLLRADGPPEREDVKILYGETSRFPDARHVRPYFDFTYDGVMRSFDESRERTGIERCVVLFTSMTPRTTGRRPPMARTGRSTGEVGAVGVGANFAETHLRMAEHGDFDACLLAGRYSLLDQAGLAELLPYCERRGIGVIATGVFKSGILANADPGAIGAVSSEQGVKGTWMARLTFDYEPAGEEIVAKAVAIKDVCDRHGVPLAAAAEQFPLHHPAVSCVLIGPREPEHVETNDGWLRHPIPETMWAELKADGLLPAAARRRRSPQLSGRVPY